MQLKPKPNLIVDRFPFRQVGIPFLTDVITTSGNNASIGVWFSVHKTDPHMNTGEKMQSGLHIWRKGSVVHHSG